MSRLAVRSKLGFFLMLALAVLMTGAARADEPSETCFGQPATIVGDEGDERIVGTDGPDVIVGLGGDDRIEAKGGDDLICGGDGDDEVLGLAGDDQLDGGPGSDRLEGDSGSDTIHGGPDGDDIVGGVDGYPRTPNTLYGDEGNDFIKGGHSNDELWGGEGDDSIEGGRGSDEVHGGPGDDDLDGSLREFRGWDRDNTVYGDDGDDRALGNVVFGGNGDDVLQARRQEGHLEGGDGDDTLYANGPDYGPGAGGGATLLGGAGDDVLYGRYLPSTLDGGAHEDGDLCDPGTPQRPNTLIDCELLLTYKQADISVSAAADASVGHVGVPLTFTVTLANAGPSIPKTMFWHFRVRGAATLDGDGRWRTPRTLTFTVVPAEAGVISAFAKVSTTRLDPDTSNNTDSLTIFVEP